VVAISSQNCNLITTELTVAGGQLCLELETDAARRVRSSDFVGRAIG